LASSLDYSSTLAGVAQAAVPAVADWCIVELEAERLQGKPPVAAHVDPSKVAVALEISRRFRKLGEESGRGLPGVIRTGKPELYPAIDSERLRAAFPQEPELAILFGQTGIVSSMVVPISARGQTLGAILLNSADPGRHYDEHDLAMAVELGLRAGLAVDNARLYREAREADRLKDEFLAMLSHELRNPLAPIVSTLGLMELRGDDVFVRERGIISRHIDHVVRLVDDLLDVARIANGKIALRRERCEVGGVLAKALEMVTPLVDVYQHQVAVSSPGTGLPVIADPARLAQVIANLLANAAKCTPPGGRIFVTAKADGGDAVICVRDNGIGIAPSLLPRVFDLFVQADGSLDRARGGLGIGLTLVKRLVELHGGSVSASSAGLGQGSEFEIRLALASPHHVSAPAHPPLLARGQSVTYRRVLVVDDNVDAADVLCEILEALGCSVRVANDGPSALDVAAEFQPEVALLDIGLPVMNGYELARRLRTLDVRPMRIVAITGYGAEADHVRSREAGFDEHLVKPVEIATMRALLAN
jgi:signal transduction histidine kinase